jgi:hypothetical protein
MVRIFIEIGDQPVKPQLLDALKNLFNIVLEKSTAKDTVKQESLDRIFNANKVSNFC